ncbi:MAG TPA: ABC transporter ATP-binding protein [Pyrinomonadaceae bacterium]|jgi:putative ABC transport system ATP-binding protein|nr:ABC transporter ATP-binding protein [Pyrinomonadaceae bacterium]
MIELYRLRKEVPSGAETLTILHSLDLTIPDGQFVSIVGPSGSGKSTLLGLIAGLDAPTAGEIRIDDARVNAMDEDSLAELRGRKMGIVFQSFHLISSLTAYENVLVPMEIAGLRDAPARARALLEDVDLTARAHHYPSQLSGGEQQRVSIARAFSNNPSILLADEPTGNLDSRNGRHVFELMLKLNRQRGTTLILITHDHELAALADRRIALRDGRVVSDSSSSSNNATGKVATGEAEDSGSNSGGGGDVEATGSVDRETGDEALETTTEQQGRR